MKVKAIASAKIKTDAVDSRTLAQLLMTDLIPQAHLRKGDNRVKQRVIRHRAFMVVMRTRVKSMIHGLVDSQLLSPQILQAKPTNLFSKKGMEWLTSLEWAKAEDKKLVESHLRIMEAINQEISTTNDMVKEIYGKDGDAQLLATILGIGVSSKCRLVRYSFLVGTGRELGCSAGYRLGTGRRAILHKEHSSTGGLIPESADIKV